MEALYHNYGTYVNTILRQLINYIRRQDGMFPLLFSYMMERNGGFGGSKG
jgi:hypothetical protein